MSAGPVLFLEPGWEPETFSTGTAKRAARAPSDPFWFVQTQGGREMVKQRFLTHFKPWLIAIGKAGALIVGYQLFDQIRIRLQRPPLDMSDVLVAAAVAISVLALFCVVWAWGEWFWFRFRSFVSFSREFRLALRNHQSQRRLRTSER